MMERRNFVKFLALLAAGAAAKPEQIFAFEQYYEANTPFGEGLVAVDEINVAGLSWTATPVLCDFLVKDKIRLPLAFNGFGGIMHWKAGPDQKIITAISDFSWNIRATNRTFATLTNEIRAYISYIGQDRVRKMVQITRPKGSLVEA